MKGRILKKKFLHNKPKYLIGQPPFDEIAFVEIYLKHKIESSELSSKDVKAMNKEINEAKAKSLMEFIKKETYRCVKIKKDDNFCSRVISLR